ncbi:MULTISPECIES: RelA/SpoT family protein [Aneurinibacillus]|uniref:GTP pyrophosphokinase n=1 Tax=Aneurinibacillus thermoaerophilus TaxID=143495 RepID=A0A1G7YB07_ANETH|nr:MULTISPECIES: bifunctional (p)ppGpp synthetase/guanosine-3',5'-bis(diphosphate) 3'-pyrophosphohydrolase [Aneurinibacillus]AMA72166.1 (p)ppGpp synthetase [Aneurinibacillus sp. XH2]MED0676452.1 bifunctional (p)ppGpp synthetase/guanosine-3',5'-bis(diphosphate) 3'-pyrophosphohydrolase [Aneurinibacillus thermoaerophilus]MED0678964.1 bifunctional (p)ppGpp synthetase/guanosine-3',5'-bis(diphosphate) 3'-pyrophosphohydrolase [Aneurinibacillus thermoaerophilus]MED0736501.1 bifunctional (p)ppGpp synthe
MSTETTIESAIDQVIEKAKAYLPEKDVEFLWKAYEFARKAHDGQVRKSGEPYIIHPIAVAGILINLQMDAVTVAAAFLHDVVEDTEVTSEQIAEEFGTEVANLVEGVTKLGRIKFKSKEQQQAENHRKMFLAMAKDLRVMLIKLADRLHNMRTLKHLPEAKQRQISDETLEIFAPLAHRLGIASIKWEMEDTGLRYINPQQYYRIVNLMKKKRAEREKYIEGVIKTLEEKLKEINIKSEISGRPKHIYSIYRKMVKQNKEFNEIYDLLAVRIIVDDIRDCYAALGIVHTLWKPMPGRFKDYIAMPKANMYQSLHTTVIGPNGEPLEVQIRTYEMHRIAEYGIAAHWAYKEGKTVGDENSFERKLSWFRQILEWQNETRDAQEFMESLKMDLFADHVFVFTPKGDVIELPKGSVPLDFAYRIHSEVGNRTIGAKVNGKIVPLDHELKTGDIVEVLTSKHSYGPSRDWLKITKSSHARNKIKQWFKKEKREENVAKGREMVENELKKNNYEPKEIMTAENLQEVANKFNFQGEEDMFAAVGYGGITAAQIATRLTDRIRKEREEQQSNVTEIKQDAPRKRPDQGVSVKGVDNLLIRFSRCCNPVPGDDIVGFITRGRGVSVHRQDCLNIQACSEEDRARLISVEWDADLKHEYNVDIEITGHDRSGLLNEVLATVADMKTRITAVSGKSDKNRVAKINMTISIQNLDHLHKVVERIKKIRDVYSVRRVMNT